MTIECTERGELLSKLRRHYADLLARVPRQINSLHCEVIAQRALDNNLTQELLNFKDEIQALTEELSAKVLKMNTVERFFEIYTGKYGNYQFFCSKLLKNLNLEKNKNLNNLIS